jgi:hypothetical protein
MPKYTDDRSGRAHLIHDMLTPCFPLDSTDQDAWERSVEWYENRESNGDSAGERLLWCLTRCKARTFALWADIDPSHQPLYEAAAQTLRGHGSVRR